jgi:hypothetical protein
VEIMGKGSKMWGLVALWLLVVGGLVHLGLAFGWNIFVALGMLKFAPWVQGLVGVAAIYKIYEAVTD